MAALPPTSGSTAPGRLRRRAEFVAAAKGKRVHMRAFSLQGLDRLDDNGSRFGFTVTKKTGGAVQRNRIRRRLKEALRLAPGLAAKNGHDYVVVARTEALKDPFAGLQRELARALAKIHSGPKPPRPTAPFAGTEPKHATQDRAPTS